MSPITAIEPVREAEQLAYEEKRVNAEAKKNNATELQLTPLVESSAQERDNKTTLMDFQYTGKGSFIDKVF